MSTPSFLGLIVAYQHTKQRIMKLLPFLFAMLMLSSCGNKQNTVAVADATGNEDLPTETSTVALEETKIVGTVRVSDSGCPLYIDAIDGDKKIKMYPVNLNENLQKEGMRIQFSYTLSRAPQPAECQVEQVVAVSNVTPYRGH
jgi:hypothetical protein